MTGQGDIMVRMTMIAAFVVSTWAFAGRASAEDAPTFTGEFVKLADGSYNIGGVTLDATFAKQVMRTCAIGQHCVLTAEVGHCRHIRGACAEVTRIISASVGTAAR